MINTRRIFKIGCFAIVVLSSLIDNASAQIIPLHGTLEYPVAIDKPSTLTVKAANGSPAYVLTSEPERDAYGKLFSIDLVLRRPGARNDSLNLLWPPPPSHGAQEFDFFASDFAPAQEHPIFPLARNIRVKNRKLNVSFSVVSAKVRPADSPTQPNDFVFDQLVIDVDVTNLK